MGLPGNFGWGRFAALVAALLLAVPTLWLLVASGVGREDLVQRPDAVYLDRYGEVLRHLPDADGERHLEVTGEAIPPLLRQAFLAAEDERFFDHFGFDLPAILRALRDNLRNGRIVSGASTITQQLARQLYPRRRTYRDKFVEILRAVRLELLLTKEEILVHYLNRVPMGNNLRGVETAARAYFGKGVGALSAAEAALLAALPKAPGDLNPYGPRRSRLLARKDWVLERMAAIGALSPPQLEAARAETLAFAGLAFPFEAPHLVDLLIERAGGSPQGEQHTTVDLPIQRGVAKILASHEARLAYKGAAQAAALVVANCGREVLAAVGSLAYGERSGGFNNGTVALRSPGSTLKPFVYALALESGFPATTLLEDTLRKYRTPRGDYAPVNYDRGEYGPVTMRVALANSLNISAIRMLEGVGTERFYALLRQAHLLNDPSRGPDHYGLGLVLGNPEVSLEQLAAAYAMLADGGTYLPLSYIHQAPLAAGERILSEESAAIVTDILADPSARLITFGTGESLDFPFRVAFKTGTSTRYRDAWIVGYTPEYTVAVWAGNFEGSPTFALSGASGAGPLLRDIIDFLYRGKSPAPFERPDGVVEARVCGMSGMAPGNFCDYVSRELFIRGTEPQEPCTFHGSQRHLHELPAPYAGWLYAKERAGTAGSYRIGGLDSPAEGFAIAWDEELPAASGIRAKNLPFPPSPGPPPARRIPAAGHVSIGGASAPGSESAATVSILYPLPGDRFLLSADMGLGTQAVKLEASVSAPVPHVEWFVDGTFFLRTPPPYVAWWKPRRGRHSISAVIPGGLGDAVDVTVE